jgi:hypothetical protein
MVPLAYVLRPVADVPAIGAQAAGTPHSIEHGSIEIESTARASHSDVMFREDNSTVYYKMEEATRCTTFSASIKPFSARKDGRGAWLAINGQYAGKDKWDAEIKVHDLHLHTSTFKGQTNYPLDKYVGSHRNAFVCLQQAKLHVDFQLPNERSRVKFLIDGIQCNDAGLQAAMASIRTDQTIDGLQSNFELAASHLLPYDPVRKRKSDHAGDKRGSAHISSVTGEETNVSSFGSKKGTGSTGVALRYHTKMEYKGLTEEQRNELRE